MTQIPQKSILVIDNNDAFRNSLTKALNRAGYRAAGTGDPYILLDARRRPKQDLVIIELDKPGPGGLDLFQRLRVAHPATPILLLTAYSEWVHFLTKAGVDPPPLLRKPPKRREILDMIRYLLKEHEEPPRQSSDADRPFSRCERAR